MKQAEIYNHGILAGKLIMNDDKSYVFEYKENYDKEPISLTMPVAQKRFDFNAFPPFFDGLLPEGVMLEALLKRAKLDRDDYFAQIIKVGNDLVGSVTVKGDV